MSRPASTTSLAVVAGVVTLLAAGCSAGSPPTSGNHRTPNTPRASSTSPSADAQAGRREAPAVGACWRVAPYKFRLADYWFDDSPRVPCSREHNTETVLVYDLDKPTPAKASELFSLCSTQARIYVRSDLGAWVPWRAAMFLPSKNQVARGESWVRCDVAMYANTAFGPAAASRAGSVRGAVNDHPADVWACVNKNLQSGKETVAPLVDCRKPHLLEATGNLLLFKGLSSYPPKSALVAEEGPCRLSLSDQQKAEGLAVKTVWLPPAVLRQKGDGVLPGLCWRFRTDRKLLPPMR